MTKIIIYLDTSDYSRFSDCLAGRQDPVAERVLEKLLSLKSSGKISISYSMALISELLQYQDGGRELTLRKARTISKLCEGVCFRENTTLLRYQAVKSARDLGINLRWKGIPETMLSLADGWNPPISESFANFRKEIFSSLDEEIKKYAATRSDRRKMKKAINKANFSSMMNSDPELISKYMKEYPFNEDLLKIHFPKLMDGKISGEHFGQLMFSNMLEPEKFVIWYFERLETDRDFMPTWMKEFGINIIKMVENAANKLEDYIPTDRKYADKMLRSNLLDLGENISTRLIIKEAESAAKNTNLLNFDKDQIRKIMKNTPFSILLSRMIPDYISSIIIPEKNARKAKSSDGGDLLHALHLPYCDLWRGDDAFSNLLLKNMKEYEHKIVRNLKDLPDRIENLVDRPSAI